MKIEKRYIELILVLALWLATIYFWSLPFQNNALPYGDVDSSIHFSIADYMTENDKVIYYLPQYINFTQGKWRAGKLWYPPQYHLDAALARLAGGERFLPMLLFFAITSSSFVITSYLLFRKLYGFVIAFFSSFLLMFSLRDISFYIFGLWPQVTSFAITPLILYAYYSFIDWADRGQQKPIYLFLSACLLAVQFFIHPQGALLSGAIAAIFTIDFILTKIIVFRKKFPFIAFRRRLPFTLKTTAIGFIVFFILLAPFMQFSVSSESKFSENLGKTLMPKTLNLFSWYSNKIVDGKAVLPQQENAEKIVNICKKNEQALIHGVPCSLISLKKVYGSYWWIFLILFVTGLISLLFPLKNSGLLLISWSFAYFLLVNIIEFRMFRLFETEALLLFPIALIGINAISLITERLIPESRHLVKYGLLILVVYLATSTIGVAAYNQLSNAYKSPPMRISEVQVEAADWLKENTPEDAEMFYIGPYVYGKKKWIRAIAQREIYFTVGEGVRELNKVNMSKDYFIVDYSDLIGLNSQQEIVILNEFEKQNLIAKQKVYDKNNIRVYKIE